MKEEKLVKKTDDKKICFIITAIGSELDPIRRHIEGVIDAAIKPILEKEYTIVVAHRVSDPGSINKQIIQYVYESELVIANLTNNNPNVMYELAFRHCTAKPTVMIAENGTKLPFDISGERVIFYQNDFQGVLELKSNLELTINAINCENATFDNPIYNNLINIKKESILKESLLTNVENKDLTNYVLERLDEMQRTLSSILSSNTLIPSRNKQTLHKNNKKIVFMISRKLNKKQTSGFEPIEDALEVIFTRAGFTLLSINDLDDDEYLIELLYPDKLSKMEAIEIAQNLLDVMDYELMYNPPQHP